MATEKQITYINSLLDDLSKAYRYRLDDIFPGDSDSHYNESRLSLMAVGCWIWRIRANLSLTSEQASALIDVLKQKSIENLLKYLQRNPDIVATLGVANLDTAIQIYRMDMRDSDWLSKVESFVADLPEQSNTTRELARNIQLYVPNRVTRTPNEPSPIVAYLRSVNWTRS